MKRPLFPALIGIAALGLAILLNRVAQFPLAGGYLFAFLFWIGLPLGALAILMLIELIGGKLDTILSATLRAIMLGVAPLVLLVAPILIRPSAFYPWARAGGTAPINPFYLQPGFFDGRAILYLAIWLVLTWFFVVPQRRRLAAAIGLAIHSLIITLAAFDWAMSLEPDWHSSEYGLLLLGGQMVGALALAASWRFGPGKAAESTETGTLLLGGIVVWFYLETMQFIILYSGDLPSEIPWLIRRDHGIWSAILALSLLCHFVVPFFALLSAKMRLNPDAVASLGGLILLGHLFDSAWLILPVFGGGIGAFVEDILALAGVGGLAIGGAWWLVIHYLPRHQPQPDIRIADHG